MVDILNASDVAIPMSTISALAKRDGISKQAVSKRVGKMLDAHPDVPILRGAKGQILKVSEAHYDVHCEADINAAKAATNENSESRDTFNAARLRNELIKAQRGEIELNREAGELIRKDMLESALADIGRSIQATLNRLPNRADEIAIAVSKEGAHGARLLLRSIAQDLGNDAADSLQKLSEGAPDKDELKGTVGV